MSLRGIISVVITVILLYILIALYISFGFDKSRTEQGECNAALYWEN